MIFIVSVCYIAAVVARPGLFINSEDVDDEGS
jgi:hypothetical protein